MNLNRSFFVAMAAPFVVVGIVRISARTQGPSPAAAAPAAAQFGIAAPRPEPVAKPLTSAERHAAEWLRTWNPPSDTASPMVATPATNVVDPKQPESPSESRLMRPPSILLSSVVASRDKILAVIDGRVHMMGDDIAPGWRLSEIRRNPAEIDIVSSDGQTITIRQPRPDFR
jgi:hypothetical protein